MKMKIIAVGVITAATLAFAGGSASAGTDNPKACFGQDRAAGVHAIGGSTWGAIAADRAGANSTQNAAYRATCS